MVSSITRLFPTAVAVEIYPLELLVTLKFRNGAEAGAVMPETLPKGAVLGPVLQLGMAVSVAPEQPGPLVRKLAVALPRNDNMTALLEVRPVRVTSGLPGTAPFLDTVRHRVVTCVLRTLPLSGRTNAEAFPLALSDIATVMPEVPCNLVPSNAPNRVNCMPRAHRQLG